MEQHQSVKQLLVIVAVFFVATYIGLWVLWVAMYPKQVQDYFESQGIHWKVPGAARDQHGRALPT